jgi:hypothetical protein
MRFVDSASNVAAVAATYGATPIKAAASWGGVLSKVAAAGAISSNATYLNIDVVNPIGIGTYGSGSSSQPTGTIKNVRIWQRALTDSQLIQVTR